MSGLWGAIPVVLVPVVVLWATDYLSHRRRAASLARTARSVGLHNHGTHLGGIRQGRKVRITRLPNREAVLALQLGEEWEPSLYASREGRSSPLVPEGSLKAAVDHLFEQIPEAGIRRGMLVVHLANWPDTEEALAQCLDEATVQAQLLDQALRASSGRWRAEWAALGLATVEGAQLEGAYRNCDLTLVPQGQAFALTAPLGPDLPQGLVVTLNRPGSQELEGLVRMQSSQPERTERLWSHPELRDALEKVFRHFPDAELREGRLRLTLAGWQRPVQQMRADLDVVCGLVQQIQRRTDWPDKRRVAAE